jgi:hypothetical protein
METKTITVGTKNFTVRELLGTEYDTIDFTNRVESVKKQIILSTGISETEYNSLTVKERLSILDVINQLNKPDFQ